MGLPFRLDAISRDIQQVFSADLAQNRALLYDKSGEEHYSLISALHKSIRNSDPDAAVYWLADESGPISGQVVDLEQHPFIGRNPPKDPSTIPNTSK